MTGRRPAWWRPAARRRWDRAALNRQALGQEVILTPNGWAMRTYRSRHPLDYR